MLLVWIGGVGVRMVSLFWISLISGTGSFVDEVVVFLLCYPSCGEGSWLSGQLGTSGACFGFDGVSFVISITQTERGVALVKVPQSIT